MNDCLGSHIQVSRKGPYPWEVTGQNFSDTRRIIRVPQHVKLDCESGVDNVQRRVYPLPKRVLRSVMVGLFFGPEQRETDGRGGKEVYDSRRHRRVKGRSVSLHWSDLKPRSWITRWNSCSSTQGQVNRLFFSVFGYTKSLWLYLPSNFFSVSYYCKLSPTTTGVSSSLYPPSLGSFP